MTILFALLVLISKWHMIRFVACNLITYLEAPLAIFKDSATLLLNSKCNFLFPTNQVTKIREQSQKQEETIREQEGELDSKRSELQKLKDEEASLEKEYNDNKNKFERLSKSLQDTQLQISQVSRSL